MGFNYTADESFQMGMNSLERKFDEMIERRLSVVEKKLESDVRENVRSEWVKYDEGDCTCLHCGFVLDDWTQAIFYNYCPNCGADMRGAEDETN